MSRRNGVLAKVPRGGVLVTLGVVAAVLVAAIGARLDSYGGDPTGFVQFGSALSGLTQPPPGSVVLPGAGYDGQFYYRLALNPGIPDDVRDGLAFFAGEFRAQRIAYPAMAGALAFGNAHALAWTLLLVNVLAALLAAAAAAALLQAAGRSAWLAVAVGVTPGVVFAVLRDLTDVCALAGGLGAWWAWRAQRPWLAGIAASGAILSRETGALVLLGVVWEVARDRELRARVQAWLPAVAVPVGVYVAWSCAQQLRSAYRHPTPPKDARSPRRSSPRSRPARSPRSPAWAAR